MVATAARRLLADHRGSAAPSLRSPQSGPVPLCLACAAPAARCLCEASVRPQEPDEPEACEVNTDIMLAEQRQAENARAKGHMPEHTL